MELVYNFVLLSTWASAALAVPFPARGTESGGGIAPWAGTGPTPPPRTSSNRFVSLFTTQASSVPFGTIIQSCTVPGTVALTFDDGPYRFTSQILDILRNNNIRGTFFVNGANWDNILTDNSRALVQRMIRENHQIGSHTWAHADLATLDRDGIVDQMNLLESALQQIIGYFPTYMRPPYFSTNDLVLETMAELDYHVINADIDTLDWANDSEGAIQTSVQRFKDGLNAGGSISLEHDVHQWTAQVLVQAEIDEIKRRGLRAVTVGECLGDPKENWYRTS
ncbi:MAG: hypothetical protein M1816_003403 [Peltula sp. TS41687]|nr:MAG: hypothetical protein M1816_003403 [Peltula sp. TS41687]